MALGLLAVLAASGGRYGYHRDELYFVEAGRHPAWGYPDQPPLVPLLAAGWDAVTGGRLGLFRLVPAAVAACTVVVAAATSRQLGGRVREQTATAAVMAVCAFAVAMGHLFSTSTFQLALGAWTLLLLLRALDAGGVRAWLPVGVVAGVSLQVQTLPAVVLACCAAALLACGPRAQLRTPGPWVAGVVALAAAAPNLVWQNAHGWPQAEVAASIAAGGSTSSVARGLVVPFQLVQAGPLVAAVLVVGAWRLAREPSLRGARWVVVGYALMLALTVTLGGKPYYADSFVPALLAAGVPPLLEAATGSRRRVTVAAGLLAAHVAGTALIALPLAAPGSLGFDLAAAANPDTAETVGWPRLVSAVAGVGVPAGTVVRASNYGEAGALDAARRLGTDVPPVYSGHNGYGEWGPPPATARSAVVVGAFTDAELAAWFDGCRTVSVVRTGVQNEEDGAPIRLCDRLRRPWVTSWPQIRHVG